MTRRSALALALAALSFSAHASYDLAFVVDRVNKRVHRFDMDSGAYFGSFGSQWLTAPLSVTADATTGIVTVYDAPGIYSFNGFTGELVGASNIDGLANSTSRIALAPDGRFIYSTGVVTTTVHSSTGGFVTSLSPAGSTITIGARTANEYWVLSGSNNSLRRFTSSGSIIDTTQIGGAPWTGSGRVAFDSGTGPERGYFVRSGGTITPLSATSLAVAGSFSSGLDSVTDLAFGHPGRLFFTGTAGGVPTVGRRLIGMSVNGPTLTHPALGEATGIAVIAAPEPSALMALGVGALAILRRRRR